MRMLIFGLIIMISGCGKSEEGSAAKEPNYRDKTYSQWLHATKDLDPATAREAAESICHFDSYRSDETVEAIRNIDVPSRDSFLGKYGTSADKKSVQDRAEAKVRAIEIELLRHQLRRGVDADVPDRIRAIQPPAFELIDDIDDCIRVGNTAVRRITPEQVSDLRKVRDQLVTAATAK